MLSRATVLVLAVVAVAAAGCASQQPVQAPAQAAGGPPRFVVMDFDASGAVLLDLTAGSYVGVSRDRGEVWRTAASAALVSCLSRCPDAALSSSLAAMNARAEPDPVPSLVVDGRIGPLAEPVSPTRRVLWGTSQRDLVLSLGSPADGWRLSMGEGPARQSIAVGGPNTTWSTSADDRHALAITATAGGNEARWFDRDAAGGWAQAGSMVKVTGFRACVAPDGHHAVLLAQKPALLDRAGAQIALGDLVAGGVCAFTVGGGVVVAELSQGTGGASRSRLRAFDAMGKVLWSKDLDHAVTVCGDPRSGRVVYTGSGKAVEAELATGAELRVHNEVAAACYERTGELMLVANSGSATWLDRA